MDCTTWRSARLETLLVRSLQQLMSLNMPCLSAFRSLFNNIFHLIPTEAIVRGHKLGLLTTADYNNLSQCDTLDDIKLYLVRDDNRCI